MNNIGIIGHGRWGKIVFKTLLKKKINIFLTSSKNKKNIITNIKSNNYVKIYKDYKIMLQKEKIDGLIITSPPSSHEEIAIFAIKKKIPILIEKPISMNLKSVKRIFKESKFYNSLVMVDYTHFYSDAYQKMKTFCKHKKIIRIISKGHSNGPVRDYSVLWDWLPHDLSMIWGLLNKKNHLEILEQNIIKKNKYGMNIKIKAKIMNTLIKISIGNLYKIKKRYFEVHLDNNSKIIYDDRKSNEKKLFFYNKYHKVKNIRALDNVIDKFINSIKRKKTNFFNEKESVFSQKITNDIENIYMNLGVK